MINSKLAPAQVKTSVDKIIFTFSAKVTKNDSVIGALNNLVNIYSYKDLMLCEIPIYSSEQHNKNGQIEVQITEKSISNFYILVDTQNKRSFKYRSLTDLNPDTIDYDSLFHNVFSFDERIILIEEDKKQRTYFTGNDIVEEYLENSPNSTSQTKLFFSKKQFNTNFSFSDKLDKVNGTKLFAISVLEKNNGQQQQMQWEFKQSKEEISPEIQNFMSNYLNPNK